jgi:hypothetical protein
MLRQVIRLIFQSFRSSKILHFSDTVYRKTYNYHNKHRLFGEICVSRDSDYDATPCSRVDKYRRFEATCISAIGKDE